MSMTCCFHENRLGNCDAPATHRLAFDTITGRPLGYVQAATPAEEAFCLTHAGVVSQGLQQRWQAAKEARLQAPPPRPSAASRAGRVRDAA